VGVAVANRWSGLDAGAAWRLRVRAGRGRGLGRERERLRRQRRVSRSLTVAELVEAYLAQHDVEQVTR
jgi:hypothetical protein